MGPSRKMYSYSPGSQVSMEPPWEVWAPYHHEAIVSEHEECIERMACLFPPDLYGVERLAVSRLFADWPSLVLLLCLAGSSEPSGKRQLASGSQDKNLAACQGSFGAQGVAARRLNACPARGKLEALALKTSAASKSSRRNLYQASRLGSFYRLCCY